MSAGEQHLHRRKGLPKLGRQSATASMTVLMLALAVRMGTSDRAGASSAAFEPTFEDAPCPAGITAEEGSAVSCGYLTVLEDRASPNGRTIRLFVTRAEPLEGDPPPDPMFGFGPLGAERDLGWSQREGVVGSRAGRVLYSMSVRGTGHSEPNMACPEIERLTDPARGITLGTPEMETALLQAVKACHDRLTAEGIDLTLGGSPVSPSARTGPD